MYLFDIIVDNKEYRDVTMKKRKNISYINYGIAKIKLMPFIRSITYEFYEKDKINYSILENNKIMIEKIKRKIGMGIEDITDTVCNDSNQWNQMISEIEEYIIEE